MITPDPKNFTGIRAIINGDIMPPVDRVEKKNLSDGSVLEVGYDDKTRNAIWTRRTYSNGKIVETAF